MTEDPLLRSKPRSTRRSHRADGPATGPMDLPLPVTATQPNPVIQTRPVDDPATRPIPRVPPAPELFRPVGPTAPPAGPTGPAAGPIGRHGQRPPKPSRLPVVAAVTAVLVVLAGVAVGVDRLTLRRLSLPRLGTSTPQAGGQTPAGSPRSGSSAPAQTAHGSPAAAHSATTSSVPSASGAAIGARHTGANVKLGVFIGSRSDVASFGRWLGRTPDYAIDFSSRGTWKEVSEPDYMIEQWRGSPYRMVYTVALLPENEPATIAAGARGDYDHYYKELASRLVAGGQGNAILRLGWEFNLASSKWSTPDHKAFIAYWRHIVTAMRSVPGQKLKFDWNVNVGDTAYDGSLYYPGSAYVDYVGVDVYDVSWTPSTYPYSATCTAACRLGRQEVVWNRLSGGAYGLSYWSNFARSKGRPMSLPEWGLWARPDGHGGADDPYFITQMHAFIDDPTNHVAYQGYFENNSTDGQHKLTTLTAAGKVFRALFGG